MPEFFGVEGLPARDKGVIFRDFPLIHVQKEGESEPIAVRALPSFIGLAVTTDGIDIGTDVFQITFDLDDSRLSGLAEKDTLIFNGDLFKVDRIARDRTLGMYLCDLRKVKPESKAGIINRRTEQ